MNKKLLVLVGRDLQDLYINYADERDSLLPWLSSYTTYISDELLSYLPQYPTNHQRLPGTPENIYKFLKYELAGLSPQGLGQTKYRLVANYLPKLDLADLPLLGIKEKTADIYTIEYDR